jgi:hypothetical protein
MIKNKYPHELIVADVYLSPIVIVTLISFILAIITTMMLNRLKISRYFFAPSYTFIAIMVLYILLIDRYWIKF